MIKTRNHIRSVTSGSSSRLVAGTPVNAHQTNAVFASRSPKKETASLFGNDGGTNSFIASQIGASPVFYDLLMTGMASEYDAANLKFYRDIYNYDTTAGSAVDLISAMPFSDFTLTGVEDERIKVYDQAIEQLNIKALFPELTVDMLTNGYTTSSLIYDQRQRVFSDCISHDPLNIERQEVPLRSHDPLLTVKRSAAMAEFLSSSSKVAIKLRQKLGADILNAMGADSVELEPLFTLYIARRTFSFDSMGTSLFKRLLPIYFLEKALYKGTMTEAGRRQRAMLHLETGNDTWEPTNDELSAIVTLFQQADLDPLGAIVATRQGVVPNEVRQGGDFWKWTDMTDITGAMKLRGLGVSEALLSGDASYANADAALSVFIQGLRSHRDRLTQAALINKILPLIAASRDFTKVSQKKETAFVSNTSRSLLQKLNDTSMWDIPQVTWHKTLGKDMDRDYFDMLKELRELGVPISLRMISAAAGVTLDGLEDDLRKEEKQKKVWEKITGNDPDKGGDGGPDERSDEELDAEMSSMREITGRRRAFLGREFKQEEVVGSTRTGKPKYIHNQKQAQENADVKIALAATKLHSDPRYAAECFRRARENGIQPWKL